VFFYVPDLFCFVFFFVLFFVLLGGVVFFLRKKRGRGSDVGTYLDLIAN
jgi:hypothetical protein